MRIINLCLSHLLGKTMERGLYINAIPSDAEEELDITARVLSDLGAGKSTTAVLLFR